MKGIINKGIQDMVLALHGADVWERVKARAGCDEPFFAVSLDYPDEMTGALFEALSNVTGLSARAAMVEFGRFMVQATLKRSYPTYFALSGSTPRAFLLNLDCIHRQATRSVPGATPPRFEYEELPDCRLLMHYSSGRRLCAILYGQILGVGAAYGQDLEVRETACMKEGAPRCTMEITFP